MKLSDIKPNPDNPRIIRDEQFAKLKKSLQSFPQMMEKRPIVVDEDNMILGGNMRFRALQDIYGKNGDIPDKWVSVAKGWTDEQKREFVIKDNVAFGEWDWAVLVENWNADDLAEWGVDLPELQPAKEPTTGEINLNDTSDKVQMKFDFTIEENAFVVGELAKIDPNKETAVLKLLGYEQE